MSGYIQADAAYVQRQSEKMQFIFAEFVNKCHQTGFVVKLQVDMDALKECIIRVHKREYYFKTFHDMPKGATTVKRVALYCFWLLKYKPFILFFNDRNSVRGETKQAEAKKKWRKEFFLERFCLYWLAVTLRSLYKTGVNRLPLSKKGYNDLLYYLKHNDVSIDALTEIFELLENVVAK